MAGAVVSLSDSFHASIIIHKQLQHQQRERKDSELLLAKSDGNNDNEEVFESPPSDVKGVGYCDQIMLVSALFGIEMCMAFEQIYEILFLQFLGVPLALVSVNGILAGTFGMIFLPLVGSWVDRGKNSNTRKLIALYTGLVIFMVGILLLIAAGLFRVGFLDDSGPGDTTRLHNGTDELNISVNENHEDLTTYPEIEPSMITTTEGYQVKSSLDYSDLSGVVVISILGFAGLDIGFDVTVSLSRALILENVPEFQHMRVLVLATIVQSTAGASCSLIGCFQLPRLLGTLFQTDGMVATLIFFCCVLLAAAIAGFLLMALANYRLHNKNIDKRETSRSQYDSDYHRYTNPKALSEAPPTSMSMSTADKIERSCSSQPLALLHNFKSRSRLVLDILHTEEGDSNTRPMILETSLSSFKQATEEHPEDGQVKTITGSPVKDAAVSDHTCMNCGCHVNMSRADNFRNGVFTSVDSELPDGEQESLLQRANNNSQSAIDNVGVSTILNTIRRSYSISSSIAKTLSCNITKHSVSNSQRSIKGLGGFHLRKLAHLQAAQIKANEISRVTRRRKMVAKLCVLCISTFFTIGASITFSVYSSNTLSLGILGGDPAALSGTLERDRYEAGLQVAAIGNVVAYVTFMVVSLANTKLIDAMGEQGQFVTFHLLMISALITLLATRIVEVYFLCMFFYGAFRTCMLTLPFVMAHKFTQEATMIEDDDLGNQVTYSGRVMTLIGFLIPTHYMILSSVMGPLMETTGCVWVPIYYCLGASCMSVAVFSTLFFI